MPTQSLLQITPSVEAQYQDVYTPAVTAALAECGAAHEVVPADAARERWPAMRFEGDVLFHPDGGRCRADATEVAP